MMTIHFFRFVALFVFLCAAVDAYAAIQTQINLDPSAPCNTSADSQILKFKLMGNDIIPLQISEVSAGLSAGQKHVYPLFLMPGDSGSLLFSDRTHTTLHLADQMADLYATHARNPNLPDSATEMTQSGRYQAVAYAMPSSAQLLTANAVESTSNRAWKPVKVYSLPEVSTLTLLAIGSVGLLIRRRKQS